MPSKGYGVAATNRRAIMKSVAVSKTRGPAEIADLVRSAEFAAAIVRLDERLADRPSFRDVELRVRLAIRRDPALAIDLLSRHRAHAGTPLARATAAMLEGAAFARLGDLASARARLAEAESAVPRPASEANGALRCEIAHQRALASWIARDLAEARAAIPPIDDPRASETLAIEIAVLHGAIAAAAERFAEQGAILLDAAARLRALPQPSVLHRATVASQLSYLAREFPNGELGRVARAEFDAIVWPAGGDLDDIRYRMLRSIGWAYAIGGDYFTAFRTLKAASLAATSDAWRTQASADRATLATALDEPRFAEQEFDDAREFAERTRWETLRGEERFALLGLAELAAQRDPSLALGYVARYRREGAPMDRTLASADDRRVEAMESYSLGIVRASLGERPEAVRLITRAWEIYHEIGYVFREGRAAVALAALTRDGIWQERAERALASLDRRWLTTPIERAFAAGGEREPGGGARGGSVADGNPLTPAQEAVYRLLLDGFDAETISGRLGRSTNTVRNHIKAIYRAYGVRSRGALLAQAHRSGS